MMSELTHTNEDAELSIQTSSALEQADVRLAHARHSLNADLPAQGLEELEEAESHVDSLTRHRDVGDVGSSLDDLLSSVKFYIRKRRFYRALETIRDIQMLLHQIRMQKHDS